MSYISIRKPPKESSSPRERMESVLQIPLSSRPFLKFMVFLKGLWKHRSLICIIAQLECSRGRGLLSAFLVLPPSKNASDILRSYNLAFFISKVYVFLLLHTI